MVSLFRVQIQKIKFIFHFQDGKVEVIANDAGDRVTPACFAYIDETIETGLSAKHQLVRNGALTVINNKIFLDDQLSDEDFEHAVKSINCICASKIIMKFTNVN